jgi:O-antigen/teichoic acid export membrane protein
MSEATSNPGSLKARAVRGSMWVIVGFGGRQALRIGSNLVMTRLLFPDAFGLMALVNVFIAGLGMFSDVGLRPSIVQSSRGDDPVFLKTAWTIQVVRGAALWAVATICSPAVAAFYEQPELARLLPVVAFVTFIAGFESTALPRMGRHLSLGKLTALQLAAQVAAIGVMMTWALIQPSIWALVAGSLTARIFTTVLSHFLLRGHRDGFGWDREAAKQLVRFGGWIFVSTVLTFFAGQADRLIFGKTIPIAMLGVYSIGLLFAGIPNQLMQRLHASVVFPAFSRKLGGSASPADFAAPYRRVHLMVLIVSGLAVTCLVAAGPWLIAALYDPRYADAGWILQILSFGTWVYALAGPPGSAIMALGKPRWLAQGNGGKVVGIAVLVPLGFHLADFPGAIAGYASAEVLRYGILAYGAREWGLGTVRRDALFSLLAAGSAFAGWQAGAIVSDAGFASWVSLVASAFVAITAWIAVAALFARHDGLSLRTLMRSATA